MSWRRANLREAKYHIDQLTRINEKLDFVRAKKDILKALGQARHHLIPRHIDLCYDFVFGPMTSDYNFKPREEARLHKTAKYLFFGEKDEDRSVKGLKVYIETGRVTIGWFLNKKAQGYCRDIRSEQDATEGFFVNGKSYGYSQLIKSVGTEGRRKWLKVE